MNIVCLCIFVCSFLSLSYQRTLCGNSDYYVAGVVETSPGASIKTWSRYVGFIEEAAAKNVDIIVFPENYPPTKACDLLEVPLHGLLKTKPVPALNSDDYDPRLVLISQAARNNSMYVIVNVHELQDCCKDIEEYCPEKKQYIFNTNLVFDRNGAIVYRYRKNYLFAEPGVTPSLEPGLGQFTTDFGVTFGILTCFDLLNPVPWQATGRNITNLVANSNWVSEMPFVTSVQTHEALAYALNVNLIMSGANNVSDFASGSGIYSGNSGALISYISGEPASRLFVAKVPKIPGNHLQNPGPIRQDPNTLEGLKHNIDESLPWHKTRVVVPGHQEFTLVHNDVTCTFNIRMRERDGDRKYVYRAGAFSGVRSVSGEGRIGVRDCAVFSCTGETIDSCGRKFYPYTENATAIFEELSIEGSTPAFPSNSTFYPVSLDINLLPLESEDFVYSVERNDVIVHKLFLMKQAPLYAFGLWGRVFEWDGRNKTELVPSI